MPLLLHSAVQVVSSLTNRFKSATISWDATQREPCPLAITLLSRSEPVLKEYQMRSWPPMGITPWQSFQGIQQSTQMMNMISGVNDLGHDQSGWWSAKMAIKWSKISLTSPRRVMWMWPGTTCSKDMGLAFSYIVYFPLLNTENLQGFGHVRLGFRLLTYILCLRACLAAKQPCFALAWISTHPRWRYLSSSHPLTLLATGAACRPCVVLGLGGLKPRKLLVHTWVSGCECHPLHHPFASSNSSLSFLAMYVWLIIYSQTDVSNGIPVACRFS